MSNDTFKNNPDLNAYFETSDGQKFYKEDLAKNHARSLKDTDVQTVFREQTLEAARETAKEIAAKIPTMDLQTAQEYLAAEISEDPRKTVVAALEKRIDELESDKDPNQDADAILRLAPEMTLESAREYLELEKKLETPRVSVIAALEKRINDGDII